MKKVNLSVDTSLFNETPDVKPLSTSSETPSSGRKRVRKITPKSMALSPKLETLYHETKYDEAKFLNYNFNVIFYILTWGYYAICIINHTLDWRLPFAIVAGMYVSDFASACLHIYLDHR